MYETLCITGLVGVVWVDGVVWVVTGWLECMGKLGAQGPKGMIMTLTLHFALKKAYKGSLCQLKK